MILLIVPFFCGLIFNAGSSPTLYDQRQDGETNVHLDVQDILIIDLLYDDEAAPSDYSYDYSDLTVKPEQPISTQSSLELSSTTPSPANGTLYLEHDNNTLTISSNRPSNSSEPNKISLTHPQQPQQPQQPLNTENFQIPVVVVHEKQETVSGDAVEKNPAKHYISSSEIRKKGINATGLRTEDLPPRNCSPGFFLDSRNRCKKIKTHHLSQRERPQLPFGLRFAQRPDIPSV